MYLLAVGRHWRQPAKIILVNPAVHEQVVFDATQKPAVKDVLQQQTLRTQVSSAPAPLRVGGEARWADQV